MVCRANLSDSCHNSFCICDCIDLYCADLINKFKNKPPYITASKACPLHTYNTDRFHIKTSFSHSCLLIAYFAISMDQYHRFDSNLMPQSQRNSQCK